MGKKSTMFIKKNIPKRKSNAGVMFSNILNPS